MTTPAVLFTKQEAMAYLLGIHCPSCGAVQPGPGLPCDACGKIPPVTAPEAERMLNSATAIASVQQKALEAEAEAFYQAAMAKWLEASEVVHLARLQDRLDAAQKAVDEHQALHAGKVAVLDEAEAGEAAAASRLEPEAKSVEELAYAVKLAMKMDHGVKAVAEASYLYDTAKADLKRYQAPLADAAEAVESAQAKVTASKARGDQLEKARDDAEAELENPGQAPMVTAAVTASPLRLLQDQKLDHDSAALELAGEAGMAICDLTGRTEQIITDARQQLLAEQEAAAKGQAMWLKPTGDGGVLAAPNPHNPNVPQPFHPPAPGSSPNPYPPAMTPGWAT